MKINETSNNSFQNKVLIDTFIEQISALQTDVGDLQIADNNLAQALATKANTADISNEVSTGTLNATNGNIKTLKVQGSGSEATLENATIGEATIGTENVIQSNITNLEVMDVDAGTVRAGTIVVENDATISGNLAVQDVGAKDITSASVNTLNLTAAEADINKLEAQNAEVTGKLEVNDLEVSGNFTGVSSIESESIESENITSDNADIETLNVENIRDWVSQVMNQEQMLTPSPQLGNVDRYTIELPSFNGVFLLSWEDSDVLWSATVIGNGKSYGISWGSKTEENYITDIFQYNGKLYIRINCNGKLKYAYSATKELSLITIYFNMDGWTKEKSLEELCDEKSHIENAYSTGTAWLGPVFIPRLVEGEDSDKGINFRGSCKFDEIPSLVDTLAGDVWNITDEAYTDNRFVEGAGKPINAGDDIIAVIVKEEDEVPTMKWDKFSAGVNYEDFVAEKITATDELKSETKFIAETEAYLDGTVKTNNTAIEVEANIEQMGNYTQTGDYNLTGDQNITGSVEISEKETINNLAPEEGGYYVGHDVWKLGTTFVDNNFEETTEPAGEAQNPELLRDGIYSLTFYPSVTKHIVRRKQNASPILPNPGLYYYPLVATVNGIDLRVGNNHVDVIDNTQAYMVSGDSFRTMSLYWSGNGDGVIPANKLYEKIDGEIYEVLGVSGQSQPYPQVHNTYVFRGDDVDTTILQRLQQVTFVDSLIQEQCYYIYSYVEINNATEPSELIIHDYPQGTVNGYNLNNGNNWASKFTNSQSLYYVQYKEFVREIDPNHQYTPADEVLIVKGNEKITRDLKVQGFIYQDEYNRAVLPNINANTINSNGGVLIIGDLD